MEYNESCGKVFEFQCQMVRLCVFGDYSNDSLIMNLGINIMKFRYQSNALDPKLRVMFV